MKLKLKNILCKILNTLVKASETTYTSFSQTGWALTEYENVIAKNGKVVSATLGVSRNLGIPGAGYAFMKVPSGYRPDRQVYLTAGTTNGSSYSFKTVSIGTNGDVKLWDQTANAQATLYFSATWIVGGVAHRLKNLIQPSFRRVVVV